MMPTIHPSQSSSLYRHRLRPARPFSQSRGLFAEQLALTPSRTEGPFYPDRLPLDTDNDLIIINDDITPAVGEITHLTGQMLDATGSPIRNATDRDLAVRRQRRCIFTRATVPVRRTSAIRISRGLDGSSPIRAENIISARSSRFLTRADRPRTFTSR